VPSADPRRKSIKAYRDGLSHGERAKLNHPKRVWTSYWEDTQPGADKHAKRVERAATAGIRQKQVELIDLLADTEDARAANQRKIEELRILLSRMLAAVKDHLPPELREEVEEVLRG
jgi:hypothetical protein